MDIHEAVLELRKKYCEQCQDQYTEKELDDGKKCEICQECEELGRSVARLQN